MAEKTNAFAMAQQQFDHVADLLSLDQQVREMLRWPMREFHLRIPIRMDDGSMRVFQGFRVQHNDARGPNKGGIRFHPAETVDTGLPYPLTRRNACAGHSSVRCGVWLVPGRMSLPQMWAPPRR